MPEPTWEYESIVLWLGPIHRQVWSIPPGRQVFQIKTGDGASGPMFGSYSATPFRDPEGRRVFLFDGTADASFPGVMYHFDEYAFLPPIKSLLMIECSPLVQSAFRKGEPIRFLIPAQEKPHDGC